jgi:multiple sugar transport system permease protein
MKALRSSLSFSMKLLLRLAFLLSVLFPFYWLLLTSFKNDKEIFTNVGIKLLPHQPVIDHYIETFSKTRFDRYIYNSVYVTVLSCIIVLAVSVIGGYALARYNFKGKNLILIIFLASQMVPLITAIIPLFVLYSKLGLVNRLASLVISYTASNIPFCLITMSSFFKRIPIALEEAAQIDGCTRVQSFMRVILPIMLPSIMAIFVFAFTGSWNELFFSIMMINSDALRTIPAGMMNFVQKYDIDWGQMSASAIITLIPVVIMFFSIQKYMVDGLTAGAVKE